MTTENNTPTIESVTTKYEADIAALKSSTSKTVSERDGKITELERELTLLKSKHMPDDTPSTVTGQIEKALRRTWEIEDAEKKLTEREASLLESLKKQETDTLNSARETFKLSGVPEDVLNEATTLSELHKLIRAYNKAKDASTGRRINSVVGTGLLGSIGNTGGDTKVDPLEAAKLAIKQSRQFAS